MYLEWNDKYKVDIKEIDRQHKSLFSVTNQLIDASNKGVNRDNIERYLIALVDYAKYRFTTEEQYFKNHIDADIHRMEYASFVHTVVEFNKKFINNEVNFDNIKISFLVSWIKRYVLKMDQRFLSPISKTT